MICRTNITDTNIYIIPEHCPPISIILYICRTNRKPMDSLKIQDQKITLVDQVQDMLLNYMTDNGFHLGDTLPNEIDLASSLGVARSVLREALSRFKMTGLIESRSRRGMIISEPSLFGGMRRIVNPMWMTDETLMDMLELRISMEIGITDSIFRNITPADIEDLESIVAAGEVLGSFRYSPVSEYDFHTKLYEISGNKSIMEFQSILHPVMVFVKDKYKSYFEEIASGIERSGEGVAHADLLEHLKSGDTEGYFKAIRNHFKLYNEYLRLRTSSQACKQDSDSV